MLCGLRAGRGVDVFLRAVGVSDHGACCMTHARTAGSSGGFMRGGGLRIFPVYYLVAVVLAVLTPVFLYRWHVWHLLFLVYLGNIPAGFSPVLYQVLARNPAADVYLGHLWSLCVEEQFYLLWPLVVWVVRDRVRLLWLLLR